jgi:hypothetical protein
LGRLDGVIDYLIYLVEHGFLTGDTAKSALRAATILREAIRREEPLWGVEVS